MQNIAIMLAGYIISIFCVPLPRVCSGNAAGIFGGVLLFIYTVYFQNVNAAVCRFAQKGAPQFALVVLTCDSLFYQTQHKNVYRSAPPPANFPALHRHRARLPRKRHATHANASPPTRRCLRLPARKPARPLHSFGRTRRGRADQRGAGDARLPHRTRA